MPGGALMTSPTTLRAEWAIVLQARAKDKPADIKTYRGFKQAWAAAKASTETPLRSDAGVRPHDVDDRKVSLEDRLRDGFMAAYRNRVGEDSPEHSQINA